MAKQFARIELEMMVDTLVEQLPAYMRYHSELAKLYKSRFDSLVREGFTEQQAVEILKTRGIE